MNSMKENFPLVLLTILGCAFVLIRFKLLGLEIEQFSGPNLRKIKSDLTFFFLWWNIFLAWIPLFLALAFRRLAGRTSRLVILLPILIIWLIFLPNAPYILTDLLHLRWRHPIPHWYDLMILVIFAWTGWQLGITSLKVIYETLSQIKGRIWARILVAIAILLCAPGIYLGRFLRYNSWDLLYEPLVILEAFLQALINPFAAPGAGIIWMLIPFLGLTFWQSMSKSQPS